MVKFGVSDQSYGLSNVSRRAELTWWRLDRDELTVNLRWWAWTPNVTIAITLYGYILHQYSAFHITAPPCPNWALWHMFDRHWPADTLAALQATAQRTLIKQFAQLLEHPFFTKKVFFSVTNVCMHKKDTFVTKIDKYQETTTCKQYLIIDLACWFSILSM